jgi:hypothetical protein
MQPEVSPAMGPSDHKRDRQQPPSDESLSGPSRAADDIARSAIGAARRGPPPVHLWNPPYCGELDIRIARDGTWYYLGTPIGRKPLVRLFASILRREGERFFLVTPVEKVGIRVDDAPFLAVDMRAHGTGAGLRLSFTTLTEDEVIAGPGNPIRLAFSDTGEPAPYVHVRRGLEALIDRKTFYRLVDACTIEDIAGEPWFGARSEGAFFPFVPARELERLG